MMWESRLHSVVENAWRAVLMFEMAWRLFFLDSLL